MKKKHRSPSKEIENFTGDEKLLTIKYNNSDKYQGQFIETFDETGILKKMRHGKGTYFWSNGDKYCGQWNCGKMEGPGSFTWATGLFL